MIFEAAGRLRIDPRPFTWRQVDDMDHASQRDAWNHTGDICYVIAQSQSSEPVERNLFNRYHQQFTNREPAVTGKKTTDLINIG